LPPLKGQESAVELGSCNSKSESVVRAARHHALAADRGKEGVLDRVGVPIGAPKPKNKPIPCFGLPSGCQKYRSKAQCQLLLLRWGTGRRPVALQEFWRGPERCRSGTPPLVFYSYLNTLPRFRVRSHCGADPHPDKCRLAPCGVFLDCEARPCARRANRTARVLAAAPALRAPARSVAGSQPTGDKQPSPQMPLGS
jgi:hypothetical protein